MNRTLSSLLGTGLMCAAFTLSAQPSDPPKVLHIFREDIKEGRGGAHEKSEFKFAQMLAKNKYPNYSLAMTTVTGTSQAWFLEAHESFDSIGNAAAFMEKETVKPEFDLLDSQDAEYRSSSRSWIAIYHPEMSYHGKELVETLPKARFFNVITFRVRQDHDQEFVELAKTAVAALDKAGSDQPVATYQIVSGAPNGTYLLFEPTASMKSLDQGPARSAAFYRAMGDSAMKKFMKSAGETIATEESVLFGINPKMSYVSKELAAGDPEFWTPKPAKPAAKPAAKAADKSSATK